MDVLIVGRSNLQDRAIRFFGSLLRTPVIADAYGGPLDGQAFIVDSYTKDEDLLAFEVPIRRHSSVVYLVSVYRVDRIRRSLRHIGDLRTSVRLRMPDGQREIDMVLRLEHGIN